MGLLEKYVKKERVYDDVHLPYTGKTLRLRRPNNRELELLRTEYEKYFNEDASNAKYAAVILKVFLDDAEISAAPIEKIEEEIWDMDASDTMAIVSWYFNTQGVNLKELMSNIAEEDFHSRIGKEQ